MILVNNNNFPDIYAELKNSIYAVAYNYLQNSNDACDIMQDSFVKLLESGQNFNDLNHIKAWTIRVCINASKNFLRDNKIHTEIQFADYIANCISGVNESHDPTVLQAVLTLPEKYRIPIHLFYYEDYSIKEIASVLGISESAGKVRLKRGRDMLRKKLEKELVYSV